jgi:hypothetical protein
VKCASWQLDSSQLIVTIYWWCVQVYRIFRNLFVGPAMRTWSLVREEIKPRCLLLLLHVDAGHLNQGQGQGGMQMQSHLSSLRAKHEEWGEGGGPRPTDGKDILLLPPSQNK